MSAIVGSLCSAIAVCAFGQIGQLASYPETGAAQITARPNVAQANKEVVKKRAATNAQIAGSTPAQQHTYPTTQSPAITARTAITTRAAYPATAAPAIASRPSVGTHAKTQSNSNAKAKAYPNTGTPMVTPRPERQELRRELAQELELQLDLPQELQLQPPSQSAVAATPVYPHTLSPAITARTVYPATTAPAIAGRPLVTTNPKAQSGSQPKTTYPNTGTPKITAQPEQPQRQRPHQPTLAATPAYPNTGSPRINAKASTNVNANLTAKTQTQHTSIDPDTKLETLVAPTTSPVVAQSSPSTLRLNPPIRRFEPVQNFASPTTNANATVISAARVEADAPATIATIAAEEEYSAENLPTIRIASPIRTQLPNPVVETGPRVLDFPTPSTLSTPNLNVAPPVGGPLLGHPALPDASIHSKSGVTAQPPMQATQTPLPVTTSAPAVTTPPTTPTLRDSPRAPIGFPQTPLESIAPKFPTSIEDSLPDPKDSLLVPLDQRNQNIPLMPLPKSPSATPPTSDETPEKEQDPDATTSPEPANEDGANGAAEEFPCDYGEPHSYFDKSAFIPDPNYDHVPFSSDPEIGIYEGKWNMCSQRPLIELGRGVYRPGVVPKSYSFLGKKNLITPGFTVFGDFRTAIAANDNGQGDPQFVWANRLNLDFDLRLTATERIHAFWGPLDEDGRFTRVQSFTDDKNELKFFEEFDDDFDTLFFEGDLGYMWGGMTDQWAPFDLPFVAGKFPLLFQNGVWINDAVEGFAFTLPAKNSRHLNWSNFDLTAFFLFDDIDSRAFNDDNAADAYGFNLFLEAYGGYTEAGYAYLEDRTGLGRSYHNMTVGFTRRYRQRLSNSVRVIVNSGQDPNDGIKTADGQILLIENSLVSSNPTFFVPYFNVFAGFGTPQNLAGQAVLQNVGINFETDALTGYPKLDDRGQDTWGGAFGFNLLGPRFSWQWILEAAMVQDFSNNLNGDQYAVGTRIQKSINYAWLARIDAMYGLRENESDISGVRAELRWKF